jgi:hypothetical protein
MIAVAEEDEEEGEGDDLMGEEIEEVEGFSPVEDGEDVGSLVPHYRGQHAGAETVGHGDMTLEGLEERLKKVEIDGLRREKDVASDTCPGQTVGLVVSGEDTEDVPRPL